MNNYVPNNYQYGFNVLPHQQVIQVNGKSSVDSIRMAPNSSVILMDTSAPLIWLCVSDGVGNVTSTPYDITIHTEESGPTMTDLEARIQRIETLIDKGVNLREQSNDPEADSEFKSINKKRN